MNGLDLSIKGQNGEFRIDAAFSAKSGITALFGPSGSGKTTLLRMIAGTGKPRHGHIRMGESVWFDAAQQINLPPEQRRIGYVFQDARLFPHMSVRANLTYAQWAGRRNVSRSFDDVVEMLGIGHLLSRQPATLSGGERQRVAIGRALLADPSLLLLDEPLSSLDHARRQEILPFIERLRDESRLPIIYVSHETAEIARLADQLVLLSNGLVTASGDAADIFPMLGREEEKGVLLEGRVIGLNSPYQLAEVDLGGAIFQLDDQQLVENMHIRLRVMARDVSIARDLPTSISIRNVLPVIIRKIDAGAGAHASLQLDFSGHKLFARLTRRSVDELRLREGDEVFALVKAVSVDQTAMRHG